MDNNQMNQNGQGGQDGYYQNNIPNNPYGVNAGQQPVFAAPQPAVNETVSVGEWIGTILLAMIPCAGLIVYIVWAFSKDVKPSKSNFCKAQLIIMLAVLVLYIVIFALILGAGFSLASLY